MFPIIFNLRAVFTAHTQRNFIFAVALFTFCFPFSAAPAVFAATFTVNSTVDMNDVNPGNGICETAAGNNICTLRAAITEANALAGDDVITLPAETYTRTLNGVDNANASGDLDITSDITINGAGSSNTFIQAAASAGTATERVLHIPTAGVTVSINGVTLRYGRVTTGSNANFGAGLRVEGTGTNVTLNNVVVSDNRGFTSGAGIYVVTGSPTLTLNNSTVSNNIISITTGSAVGNGGGIFLSTTGTININNSLISNNTLASTVSNVFGAGIALLAGTVNVTSSSISNNRATGNGTSSFGVAGGIYNLQAVLNVDNSTLSNNITDFHAGIRTEAQTTAAATIINQSAIINNTANFDGGGIINASFGTANTVTSVNNSTIGGNTAAGNAGGVGNFNVSTGSAIVNLNYSTVAGNAANSDNSGDEVGGGVANLNNGGGSGPLTINLTGSIVADNTVGTGGSGPDIAGTITSLGYNHVEDIRGGIFMTATGDVTGVDPGLMPLANNGGPTLTYLPGPNSPVRDTIPNGVNGCGVAPFNVDQRGVFRPTDSDNNTVAACEKGSVEVFSPTAAAVSVTGRVFGGNGKRGLANAFVKMTDFSGITRTARTNAFGYFRFADVEAGQTYVFSILAKRYRFQAQVINVNNDLTSIEFVPLY